MLSAMIAAAGFGFLGSLHCTLMCGPLAFAGCARNGRVHGRSVLAYFGGRLCAYAFAGSLFGFLGAHAQRRLPVQAVHRALLIAVAAAAAFKGARLLLASRQRSALVPLRRSRPSVPRWLLPRRALPLGLATGALPCGLLAGAWGLAAASGDPVSGALVMAAFSFATLPALAASLCTTGVRFRPSPALAGALWCALAIWIGARPLFVHASGCH